MRFDVDKWRAKARRTRRSANLNAVADIEKVHGWCDDNGVTLNFVRTRVGEYNPDTNTITIPSRICAENQLFIMLHEIGHHLIDDHGSARERISKGYRVPQRADADSSLHYKIDVLEEEYEAWHEGRQFAKDLLLDINVEKYHRYKIAWIKTYIDWAAGTTS